MLQVYRWFFIAVLALVILTYQRPVRGQASSNKIFKKIKVPKGTQLISNLIYRQISNILNHWKDTNKISFFYLCKGSSLSLTAQVSRPKILTNFVENDDAVILDAVIEVPMWLDIGNAYN